MVSGDDLPAGHYPGGRLRSSLAMDTESRLRPHESCAKRRWLRCSGMVCRSELGKTCYCTHVPMADRRGFIVTLASLQDLPIDLEDTAKVDGAGTWQIFWQILLCLIDPIL